MILLITEELKNTKETNRPPKPPPPIIMCQINRICNLSNKQIVKNQALELKIFIKRKKFIQKKKKLYNS